MEMNVEKTKVMGISAPLSPIQDVVLSKTTVECGIFQLFG